MNKTVSDHEDRLTTAEGTILLLKSMGATAGSGGKDGEPSFIDALQILVENLRKECYAKFADREEFINFKKRVEDLEKHMKEVDTH